MGTETTVDGRFTAIAEFDVEPEQRDALLDTLTGAAAAAVDYPPGGIRGVAGLTRASRFGTVPGYHRDARREICLLVQIETRAALDALEDIAAVPGIDGVFIGPADLAASMGYPGEPGHPEVKAAVLDGVRRIRKAGKPAGVLSVDQGFLRDCASAGTLFTAVDIDAAILLRGARARAREWGLGG